MRRELPQHILNPPRPEGAFPQSNVMMRAHKRVFQNAFRHNFAQSALLEDSCNARQAKICALRFPSMRPQLGAAAAAPHAAALTAA